MLIVGLTALFWVTTRIGLIVLMLKNTILIIFLIPLWNALFKSCLFKAPLLTAQSALIGQLTHALPSIINNNRAPVLNQSF